MELTQPLSERIAAILRDIVEPLGAMAASAMVAGNPTLPEEDRRDLLIALEERAGEAADLAQDLSITIRLDGSIDTKLA